MWCSPSRIWWVKKKEEEKKLEYFCWWHMTSAGKKKKDVVSLVSAPAILGTGSTQDPNLAPPVCFHKALEQQKSFPWAADRSSIQAGGCADNVRCQGTSKHSLLLNHDSSSLCSCQGLWLGKFLWESWKSHGWVFVCLRALWKPIHMISRSAHANENPVLAGPLITWL